MAKKMLIDATHLEETRVVVVDGNKVDDFDFESVAKRQLSGNIYLAKVTRVEPSLQAAFVDYGGNRHGFLAFAEIHPDYYQIPVADREALIAEEAAEQERTAAGEVRRDDEAEKSKDKPRRSRRKRGGKSSEQDASGQAAESTDGSQDKPAREASAESSADQADADKAPAERAPKGGRSRRGRKAEKHKSSGLEVIDFDEGGAGPDADAGNVHGLEIADLEDGNDASGQDEAGDDAGSDSKDSPPKSMAEKTGLDEAESVSEDVSAEGEGEESEKKSAKDAEKSSGKSSGGRSSGGRSSGRGRKRGRQSRHETGASEEEEDRNAAQGEGQNGGQGVETIESIEPDEPQEDAARARAQLRRRYRIQDVIKVRQIMLVQVVKEERGNKGAALTTYLSLPGRYCVLMPNTARGGGISRKITNAADRKRLRGVVDQLDVPTGMGLIVRTAGAERTRAEIKRDFEFLLRQWEQIRELTLNSIAPTLIYEEGSLIKRSIRDLYSKDIDAILVEGEAGYREAKDYMKMLMPSHARHVQQYTDRIPLFIRYQVESYLSGMFNPVVQLRSGGYIVIGQTEALVAIDVNSGRSTRESSIEETALKTNLEAADEIARQLRLRDLAGLIVIDFIDMDDGRNNRAVEKRLKDRLKVDRARLQIGRISPFGLLEMSRQRLRPGMVEISTQPCPHCHGQGTIRSDESLALTILREIEEEGVRGRAAEVNVSAPIEIANFIINAKRRHLSQIEERYGLAVTVAADPMLRSPEYKIEPSKTRTRQPEEGAQVITAESAVASTTVESPRAEASAPSEDKDKGEGRSRRRRGKRGGRRRRGGQDWENQEAQTRDESAAQGSESSAAQSAQSEADADQKEPDSGTTEGGRRGRKRRGGRGRHREQETSEPAATAEAMEEPEGASSGAENAPAVWKTTAAETWTDTASEKRDDAAAEMPSEAPAKTVEPDRSEGNKPLPQEASESGQAATRSEDSSPPESDPKNEKPRAKRRGWWQWR